MVARTSTRPQAPKQYPTRKRHRELRRRDQTVKFRMSFMDGWNDPRRAFIERTAGWDTIDTEQPVELIDFDYFDVDSTFDVEPYMLPCGCINNCEYDGLYPDDELYGNFDDYATNEWDEPVDEQFDDEWGDSDEELDDDVVTYYDGYAKIGAVYVIDTGAGFGLDAVFGEGYLSGNCGFSVRTRP